MRVVIRLPDADVAAGIRPDRIGTTPTRSPGAACERTRPSRAAERATVGVYPTQPWLPSEQGYQRIGEHFHKLAFEERPFKTAG